MNYYNDNDPAAAEWLRELIAKGYIPNGDVDTRSITSVENSDLKGYTQAHFFAGIGGWSLALQLAGWPEDRPVWTGSCPCQPYSIAGKHLGNADERDLWPAFFRLITGGRPEFIFGEQVESAIRYGWLDRVYADLEGEGYSVGAAVLGAHSVGAPHRRQRLYWGGVRMAPDTECVRCGRRTDGNQTRHVGEIQTEGLGAHGSVADCDGERQQKQCGAGAVEAHEPRKAEKTGFELRGPASFSPWDDFVLIRCRDGKARRVPAESVLRRMADGIPDGVDAGRAEGVSETEGFPVTTQTEGHVMLLRGYGNSIVPQVAAEFIRAFTSRKE